MHYLQVRLFPGTIVNRLAAFSRSLSKEDGEWNGVGLHWADYYFGEQV